MKRNLKDVKLTWNSPMIISNPTHKLTPIYIIDSYENRETKEVQIEYALMPHNEQTRKSETFYASSINTVVHIENKPKYKIYSDGLGIRGGEQDEEKNAKEVPHSSARWIEYYFKLY